MNSVKTESTREHPHLGVLFHRARRLIDDEILRDLSAAGFVNLRPAHDAVFSYMPTGGTRLTDLARRARITKQSMGELVRELEGLGYVERVPDPLDGRALVIRYTDKGRRADAVGVKTVTRFERKWARMVGRARMDDLRLILERMVQKP
jgi:DNA-binding MarR family transcriptional regulator